MADARHQTKPAASLENRLLHVKGIITVFYRI